MNRKVNVSEMLSKVARWVKTRSGPVAIRGKKIVADLKRYDFRQATVLIKRVNWKSPRVIATAGTLGVVLLAGGIFLNSAASAYAITANGQQITVVKSKKEADNAIQQVLAEKGKNVGQVAFTKEELKVVPVWVKEYEVESEQTAQNTLGEKLEFFVKGYVVSINGNPTFTLGSRSNADEALQKLKDKYAQPSEQRVIESVEFEEKVEVAEIDVKSENIDAAEKVIDSLLNGKVNTVAYKVQQNDSLWTIARKNNMLIKDLLDFNSNLTPQTVLKIGQKIDIVKVEPYVNVVVKGTQTLEEIIPYSTVYKTDPSVGVGKSKTVTQGEDGSKEVSFRFVAKNNSISQKVVLTEKIKEKPVSEVIAKGPSAPRVTVASVSRGSGSVSGFGWPLRGLLTSGFYRHGTLHGGIDIDGETGDPYYASQSGTVVAAGWNGGYGQMILIDHGNGVQTRYAHSSRLLVGVGQRVSKGQAIGLVGNTGRSYGSHLHFEIIINGTRVNPLNYL